ncbi:MAG: acyl-CoA dehydrogenase family protein, partial [Ilumatobacteraceae bacterium]
KDAPHLFHQIGEMLNAHTTAVDVVAAMFVDSDNLQFANTDEHASRVLSRKSVASSATIDTVRLAMEVAGGTAFCRDGELERLLRDAHAVVYHPLPRAKQTLFSGRVALGLTPIG